MPFVDRYVTCSCGCEVWEPGLKSRRSVHRNCPSPMARAMDKSTAKQKALRVLLLVMEVVPESLTEGAGADEAVLVAAWGGLMVEVAKRARRFGARRGKCR